MAADKITELKNGLTTAFIDSTFNSNLAYKPQLVYNNYKNGQKVFSAVEDELRKCDKFAISVAFITRGGITPLLQTLRELEKRNVPGRILTTDYLAFSDPVALDTLAGLSNIELRMYETGKAGNGFHTKGYIFRENEEYRFIIGSSNLTQDALTKNIEWNTRLVSTEKGEMLGTLINEFDNLWNDRECTKEYKEFIDNYRHKYREKQLFNKMVAEQKRISKKAQIPSLEAYTLKPNSMQLKFINNLMELRKNDVDRALLISATGTGKTYASAFAMRELGFKKVLFLVHREQILKQAKRSYENVFSNRITTGILSGNHKDMNVDYLFSTVQTMSRDYILTEFEEDRFDCIIIDETHKAGAESYHKIINHFKPKLLLGMTASPERTDGFDIYKLFGHNIASEIRLQDALEDDLLCPFHYFGISDLVIDGKEIDEKTEFKYLANEQRVEHIIEQAEYFGYSGNRVKGLIFCSRKDEAKALSEAFNDRGYNTVALSGDDSQEKREEAIERLEMECEVDNCGKPLIKSEVTKHNQPLDYIFTVDIFNEGVDIPQVNQVIMLRPTQSAIIFVQQLGRGLRKADNKEYVVILDFIGNYSNNFLIPIALSGDRTYNKDNVRKYVREGSRLLPGCSTIHFDEITKKKIFASIDRMTTTKKMLTEKYMQVKFKIGRIPTIIDFYKLGEIDPMLFINYAKTYDNFQRAVDKDYTVVFTEKEEQILAFISSLIIDGKRPHELLMLKMMLDGKSVAIDSFAKELVSIGEKFKEADYNSAVRMMSLEFVAGADANKFAQIELLSKLDLKSGLLKRSLAFLDKLNNTKFREEISNLLDYGMMRYKDMYANHDENNLVLYGKYSRKDVCRLMNWDKDESSTMYGYRIKHGTCPIFVTYEKKDDISESTKYEDQFINQKTFSWLTRSNVAIDNRESQEIINYKNSGLKIVLFIKKSDGEGTDFYYMGEVVPKSWMQKTIKNNKGKELPIMNFIFELEHSVREDIYEYLTN
ncbi:MAG: DEAD/DEAH box helicase [Eubacterium sp.]|nr:DEAD/DEAH box helicase [Eubacterium sp.]